MKKTMTIIIAALLICTFAGCTAVSSAEIQGEESSSEISRTSIANDDETKDIRDSASDTQTSEASDT